MDTVKMIQNLLWLWGCVCIGIFFLGSINNPIRKMPTRLVLKRIERECINFERLSEEQKKNYGSNKKYILQNEKYLIRTASKKQGYLAIATLLTSLFCFIGALIFPRIMRKSFEST